MSSRARRVERAASVAGDSAHAANGAIGPYTRVLCMLVTGDQAFRKVRRGEPGKAGRGASHYGALGFLLGSRVVQTVDMHMSGISASGVRRTTKVRPHPTPFCRILCLTSPARPRSHPSPVRPSDQ